MRDPCPQQPLLASLWAHQPHNLTSPSPPCAGKKAARECEEAGGKALALQLDVLDDNATELAIAAAVEKFGGIDILINNASAIDNSGTLGVKAKK